MVPLPAETRASPAGRVTEARLLRVTGVVQGVGFRPFVHRLAERHGLAGAVRNGSGEVEIEIEGPAHELDAFLRELTAEAPPLARIQRIEARSAVSRERSRDSEDVVHGSRITDHVI